MAPRSGKTADSRREQPQGDENKVSPLLRSAIARSIASAARTVGLSDRGTVERLTDQAVWRLEHRQGSMPLPGWGELVPGGEQAAGRRASEIGEIIREVLAQSEHPELVAAYAAREARRNGSDSNIAAGVEDPAPEEGDRMSTTTSNSEERTGARAAVSENALKVLEKRYFRKDDQGRPIENAEEMFRRVAHNIAQADLLYDPKADLAATEEEFFGVMAELEFMPNSPTLMNAGLELQQLSACFVLPVEDSIEAIFDSVKHTALIHKSGGGTGFSFSRLRPQGDQVRTTGGVASGPVSFMKIFDAATNEVKQGGTRRGANMGILHVTHPDILDFISAKDKETALNNFNISVAVTDDFMRAVESGGDYELINPRSGEAAGKLNAREVFEKMVQGAWRNGDPGIIFIDRMNKDNPTPQLGRIESTNPCGEQPLLPYESCNLGSINLAKVVRRADGKATIDWDKLGQLVDTAAHFLDNVIDMNHFPLPQIEEMTRKTRKIGLGVMGFADMLIALRIPYDSEEALRTGEQVMRFIFDRVTEASARLAEKRGVFAAFEGSIYDRPGMPRVRNACRATIAPTGSISIISDCSGGIEPLFALAYTRHTNLPQASGDGRETLSFVVVDPAFERVAKDEGFWSETLMEEIAERGTVRGMKDIPDWVQSVFATAHDIAPEWHVRMQAAFQRYTDAAVSKTVNFPNSASVKDVTDAYMLAWHEGCKGITVYRDGSRQEQVLTTHKAEPEAKAAEPRPYLAPRERPRVVRGVTEMVRTGHGRMYITMNFDDEGRPFEVFSALGKAGGCDSAQLEAISRLVSLALRSGVDPEEVVSQLRGITCCPVWDAGVQVRSAPDAVALAMSRHALGEEQKQPASPRGTVGAQMGLFNGGQDDDADENGVASERPRAGVGQCPECSGALIWSEGCHKCMDCGYTRC